jgi:hypothetical protein
MEKQAVTAAGELLKALYKLPGGLLRGGAKTLKDTNIGPFLKDIGGGAASALTKSFYRNPFLTSGIGLGGVGLLGHLLTKGGEEPKGYLSRLHDFYNRATDKMSDAYPGSLQADPLTWAGKGIREFAINPILKPVAGSVHAGPATAAALGALGGSGIGGLTGLIRGGLGDLIPGMLAGAGVGGLGLGALSALMHKNDSSEGILGGGLDSWGLSKDYQNPFLAHADMMKSSSVKKAQFGAGMRMGPGQVVPSQPDIVANIYRQPSVILSLRQKQELSNQVSLLTPYQLDRLSQLLRGAAGAGVAYIISKYLLSLGKKSTIISVILGGIAGAMTGGGSGGQRRTQNGLIFNPRGY